MISLDFIIGTLITVVIAVGLYWGIHYTARKAAQLSMTGSDFNRTADVPMLKVARRILIGCLALTAVIYLASTFPWSWQYHSFRTVDGTVAAVDARFLGDGNSTTQNYAVRLDDGTTYRCDDTRCALVKPGDHLTLSCIRDWQYAAEPGWVCRFVATRPAAS